MACSVGSCKNWGFLSLIAEGETGLQHPSEAAVQLRYSCTVVQTPELPKMTVTVKNIFKRPSGRKTGKPGEMILDIVDSRRERYVEGM